MKPNLLLAFVLGAAPLASAADAATVITFDELSHSSPTKLLPRSVQSGGLTFSHLGGGTGMVVFGTDSPQNANPGGATINNWNNGFIKINRTDGKLFTLNSIDLSDLANRGETYEIEFSFFDGAKLATERVTLDNQKGLQTFDFDRSLEWFSLAGINGNYQLDNLVWSASAVPEPATWAMMLLGFGAVGASMRRRRPAIRLAPATRP